SFHANVRRAVRWEGCPRCRVNIRFAVGPGFPTLVNPEPLINISTGVVFYHFGEPGGIEANVIFEITGPDKRDLGIEPEPMLSECAVPKEEAGDHRSACPKSEHRQSSRRASRHSEEIAKHALVRERIGVRKKPDRLALAKRFQDGFH